MSEPGQAKIHKVLLLKCPFLYAVLDSLLRRLYREQADAWSADLLTHDAQML